MTKSRWDPVGKQFLEPDHPVIVALDAAKAEENQARRDASMQVWQGVAASIKVQMAEADRRSTEARVRGFIRRTGLTEADYWNGLGGDED